MNSDAYNVNRRTFLEASPLAFSIAALLTAESTSRADDPATPPVPLLPLTKTYRAAAIGSTGNGDFGHGLDTALVKLPNVEFVAIANDNPAGLEAAGKRCGVASLYSDYRRMLEVERLDLVTIGMRHVNRHEDTVIRCAEAGKHLYCEKPLATDLASLDRMVAACNANGVKLSVALPNRVSPAIQQVLKMVREGRIGKLRAIHTQGKCDHRGGGEDLMVLGYHSLDLMCLVAGAPQWTFAHVMQGESDVAQEDGRPATEPIGPIAGDCIAAMFGFENQVHGYFQSHQNVDPDDDRFTLEIQGSKGIIVARSLADVMWLDVPSFNPAKAQTWQPIHFPAWESLPDKYHWCHQQLILDLLSAVEQGREPLSGIGNVRWVQEMIQSVYVSHFAESRQALPLPFDKRSHPLS